jgi:chitosanase
MGTTAGGGAVFWMLVAALALAPPGDGEPKSNGLSPEQKRRADQLISVFENGTIAIQHGYAEALGDGRGITFGRSGFTTATGDGYELIKRYTAVAPENPLVRYLPRLQVLARAESGSTEGLVGFVAAVRQAARDPRFRQAQDDLQDELYYRPAARYAATLGLKTALARALVYDTLLMHGDGDDPDGLPALLEQARKAAGGTPAAGVDETAWFSAFLRIRRAVLAHAHDPATRKAWAEAVGRADVFRTLAEQGNWDLHGPIVLTGEFTATIP